MERIDVHIAQFGMGVPWEQLPSIGPFRLPPDPKRIEDAFIEWTPQRGGHRCLRGQIHVEGMANPLLIGRNLDVVQAGADEQTWLVPFHLGNPERERAPIVLQLGADDADDLRMALRIAGRDVLAGQLVWLRPGEVVEAELRLFAPTGPALDAIRTVEAFIGGHLIDGIQVNVQRPALAATAPRHPAELERGVHVRERELSLVR